jgi:hypothetical protein
MKPGTYKTNRGDAVQIQGPARVDDIDGQPIFWSLQGDHYAADGRAVLGRLLRQDERTEHESFLASASHPRSLQAKP